MLVRLPRLLARARRRLLHIEWNEISLTSPNTHEPQRLLHEAALQCPNTRNSEMNEVALSNIHSGMTPFT